MFKIVEQTTEAHAQSVEDNLIDSLSFQLRPGASYITDRRSVSFFPQGGNSYSPAGVKVIKMMLTGDSWMDPSAVKLFMTIKNDSAGNIIPLVSGAWYVLPSAYFVVVRLWKTSICMDAYTNSFT